jgi:hypothetical protein
MTKNKSKKISSLTLNLYRQTRSRTWVVNPVTQVVTSKKKKNNRNACRTKKFEE